MIGGHRNADWVLLFEEPDAFTSLMTSVVGDTYAENEQRLSQMNGPSVRSMDGAYLAHDPFRHAGTYRAG